MQGGHYEPHFDASFREKKQTWKGLRLATFMLYLSDVAHGGATVFPKIGCVISACVPPRPHVCGVVFRM